MKNVASKLIILSVAIATAIGGVLFFVRYIVNPPEDVSAVATAEHVFNPDIKDIVAGVSDIIDKHPAMKEMNFGLFYQHGRLGFVDLDAFAESTKAKINVDGEEKTLTEIKNDIDKDKE